MIHAKFMLSVLLLLSLFLALFFFSLSLLGFLFVPNVLPMDTRQLKNFEA